MLTTDDKKFILETFTFAITENNKILNKKFDGIDKKFVSLDRRFDMMDKKIDLLGKSLSKLSEETVELFTITNKRLEEVNLNLSNKIDSINGVIVNHEHRIEKIEDKVFMVSA